MPITDDEVVKVMAREMFYVEFDRGMGIWEQMCMWEQESQDRQTLYLNQARAALAYVRPIIEREARVKALDQIATLCDPHRHVNILNAILALKDTPHD